VVLAGGRSSRLQTSLVENKELALAADADYDRTSQDPSLFTLSMRIAPGKSWQDAEAALYQEVENLKTQLVSTKELERAKNLVESSFTYGQDCHSIVPCRSDMSRWDWSLIQKVIPGIRAVTAKTSTSRQDDFTEETPVGLLIPEGHRCEKLREWIRARSCPLKSARRKYHYESPRVFGSSLFSARHETHSSRSVSATMFLTPLVRGPRRATVLDNGATLLVAERPAYQW
jgi:hypothetical protein